MRSSIQQKGPPGPQKCGVSCQDHTPFLLSAGHKMPAHARHSLTHTLTHSAGSQTKNLYGRRWLQDAPVCLEALIFAVLWGRGGVQAAQAQLPGQPLSHHITCKAWLAPARLPWNHCWPPCTKVHSIFSTLTPLIPAEECSPTMGM